MKLHRKSIYRFKFNSTFEYFKYMYIIGLHVLNIEKFHVGGNEETEETMMWETAAKSSRTTGLR